MQILEFDYMHEDKKYFCIFEMRDFFKKNRDKYLCLFSKPH